MFTTIDEGKGVVKTTWEKARARFSNIAPYLTTLIDKVSPNNNFPIYLLYFPYGTLKGDTTASYFPLMEGGIAKLSDPNIDKTMLKDLGYGMHSSPVGIIIDKFIEYFVEFSDFSFPYLISGPGSIFNRRFLLEQKGGRNYRPNSVLNASSGSRTAFMLPSINNHNGISRLSRKVGVDLTTPRKLADHFNLFRSISQYSNNNWCSCLAYFSENWINHILTDPAWFEIKHYIANETNQKDSFSVGSIFFDIFCSKAQKDRNLRTSSPYLTNTAIHLIKIALGEYPGYIPAINEEMLPLNNIQDFITNTFQLKKAPTVMVPHQLIYEKEKNPVYYSLQYPTTPNFLAKKNEHVTANQEIDILNDILSKLIDEMSKDNSFLSGTVFADLSKNVRFNYFHNYPPRESKLIQSSRLLSSLDPRFIHNSLGNQQEFSFEGQFLRGCIQIQPTI